MDGMSHSIKFRVIRSAIEEERDGNDYTVSAQAAAGNEIGVGRTYASFLDNHPDMTVKRAATILMLDTALEKHLPDLGSAAYQALWTEVKRALDRGVATSVDDETLRFLDGHVIANAYFHWAPRALDPNETPATRLRYGRMAEKVLYDYVFKFERLRKRFTLTDVAVDDARKTGREVADAIVQLLLDHAGEPPAGLFDDKTTLAARRRGYRWFKTRMLADQVGWRSADLKSDKARAEFYAAAYKTGLADDLMWLSSVDTKEIAHPNNAWNLAFHASEWEASARFAARFFAAFPSYISGSEPLLTPMPDDRSVWPGLAAVLAHTQIAELDRYRQMLLKRKAGAPAMLAAIEKMIPGIRANLTYVEVLNLGEAK